MPTILTDNTWTFNPTTVDGFGPDTIEGNGPVNEISLVGGVAAQAQYTYTIEHSLNIQWEIEAAGGATSHLYTEWSSNGGSTWTGIATHSISLSRTLFGSERYTIQTNSGSFVYTGVSTTPLQFRTRHRVEITGGGVGVTETLRATSVYNGLQIVGETTAASNPYWWRFITSPGNAPSITQSVSPQPQWQLVSGSTTVTPTQISAFQAENWATIGGTPHMFVYQWSVLDQPPLNGARIRYFSASAWIDVSPDLNGYTSMSMSIVDLANAIFEPAYPFTMTQIGTNYGANANTIPNQVIPNDTKRRFQVIGPSSGSLSGGASSSLLTISIVNPTLYYGFHSASYVSTFRKGLFINAYTGSPQLSLEPTLIDPYELFEGDIWFRTGSDGRSSLFWAEKLTNNQIIKVRPVVTRTDESSSAQIIARFGTPNRPTGSIVPINAAVASDWFITVNTPESSGSGWRNESWGGGVYMPDSGTVSVWQSGIDKNFGVPSGSLIVQRNITAVSGSVIVNTGSLYIPSGSMELYSGSISVYDDSGSLLLSGSNARLNISGAAAYAYLRGWPVLSVQSGSLPYTSLSPVPPDGTMYANTLTRLVVLRVSGSWIEFAGSTPGSIDGGTY